MGAFPEDEVLSMVESEGDAYQPFDLPPDAPIRAPLPSDGVIATVSKSGDGWSMLTIEIRSTTFGNNGSSITPLPTMSVSVELTGNATISPLNLTVYSTTVATGMEGSTTPPAKSLTLSRPCRKRPINGTSVDT